MHERFFQVVKVEAVTISTTPNGELSWTIGDEVPPAPFEVECRAGAGQCQEDTILVYSGTATTVRVSFPGLGLAVISLALCTVRRISRR